MSVTYTCRLLTPHHLCMPGTPIPFMPFRVVRYHELPIITPRARYAIVIFECSAVLFMSEIHLLLRFSNLNYSSLAISSRNGQLTSRMLSTSSFNNAKSDDAAEQVVASSSEKDHASQNSGDSPQLTPDISKIPQWQVEWDPMWARSRPPTARTLPFQDDDGPEMSQLWFPLQPTTPPTALKRENSFIIKPDGSVLTPTPT